MQKWEYLSIEFRLNGNKVDHIEANGNEVFRSVQRADAYNYLNKLGRDSWEMIDGRRDFI